MFEKSDLAVIQTMGRWVSPTSEQINQIYSLYKKYIDASAKSPTLSNCNCNTGISYYWKMVIEFGAKNSEFFINEG